ncbi:hypothetical protein [Salmonirosea aquatica]|uniref:SGNH/GDSL hydrolase family protein n=1 Tax=Salmonirosea aquatica TaxID=2654236 RepID=A0A7C9FPP2_9BACT|nr:hypothetical protein [Cytophagaceae bacterium SJW1-29]
MPRRRNDARSARLRFLAVVSLLFIVILLLSFGILAFEFIYGNADGVWHDIDVVQGTYQATVILAGLGLLMYGLFFGPNWIKGVLGTLILTLLLLLGLEKASLWLVNRNQSKPLGTAQAQPFLRPDHTEPSVMSDTLGVRARPNWHIRWVPLKDNVRYDTVTISTDSLGRRATPLPDSLPRPRYALFLGCSYTYGDGVSDTQTLPYYFQALSPTYRAYNYGYMAYSPLHTLALLQQGALERQIPQKDGFAVFTLINDHLDRVIPATRWIELTQGRFPYLDKKTMHTEGIFADKRRLYTQAVLNFQGTGLQQIMKWGYPRTHTDAHYQLLVDIIKKSEEEYTRHFGNNRFYVVVFPGNPLSAETERLFKAKGIHYFDYSGLMSIESNMLPFDNAHPAPQVYERVARQLSRDLDSLGTKRTGTGQ